MTPPLLTSIEEMDGAWVREVLLATYPNMPEIVRVEYAPIGHGNASDTFKIALDYAAPADDAPETVVLKIHASNPQTAQAAADAGSYRCEHEMTRILPNVASIRVPRFYYANISADNRRANILMQDLSAFCQPGDQIDGASPAQALAAIRELLKLHKHFWNSPQLDDFDWTVDGFIYHHQGLPVLKDRLSSRLSEEELQILDRSMPYIDEWLDATPRNRALIHTDCRVDNILFDRTEPQDPKAYIIDWANCKAGDAMADITYLLASSVDIKDRAECERKAIANYAQEIATLDSSYTAAQATEDYRRNIPSSMFLTLLAAAFIPQTPHTDLLLETLARRNCAAHKDWLFS